MRSTVRAGGLAPVGIGVLVLVGALVASCGEPGAATPTTAAQPAAPECVVSGLDRGAGDDGCVSPPNVILFLTDDQTIESMRVLERVRELIGDQGMTFENSYVEYPTCCPSRATYLTGQHAINHGVLWNAPPTGGFQNFRDQETALPAALEQGGYHPIHIGKYLNGYGFFRADRFTPPGWRDFQGLVAPADTLYFNYSVFDNGDIVTYGARIEEYQTDVLTARALDSLEAAEATGRPFYLQLAYLAPHAAAGFPLDGFTPDVFSDDHDLTSWPVPVPAPRHDGLFKDERLPANPAYNEDDVTDKPEHMRRKPMDAERQAWVLENYRTELETLLAVDESVDRIVGWLNERGLLNETYLIFTSDNGFFHGEHRFPFSKFMPYDEAAKVPLLVRGPGIEPGSTQRTLVSNIDIVPTVLQLAGADALREPDGRSLVPLLADPAERWDRVLLIEGAGPPTIGRRPYQAVRSERWMYTEYDNGGRELYDMLDDPHQLDNLADDPTLDDVRASHRRALDELRSCAGSACHDITL